MTYILRFAFFVVVPVAYVPLVWVHSRRFLHSDLCGCLALVLSAVMCLWMRLRGAATPNGDRFQPSSPIGSKQCLETNARSWVLKSGRIHTFPLVQLCNHLSPPLRWLLTGMAMLILAVLSWSPWLASVAFVVVLVEILRRLTSKADRPATQMWLLLLLLLLLPVVLVWDGRLVFWLQGVSSRAGSLVLDFLACDHLLASRILQTPGRKWPVEEICRGILSPFSLVAAAAIFGVWMRRQFVHALLMLGAGIFWTVIGNVLCVTCVVGMHERYSWDLSTGLGHSLLGLGWFGLGLWMLFCTDRLLLSLLAPIRVRTESARPRFAWPWA